MNGNHPGGRVSAGPGTMEARRAGTVAVIAGQGGRSPTRPYCAGGRWQYVRRSCGELTCLPLTRAFDFTYVAHRFSANSIPIAASQVALELLAADMPRLPGRCPGEFGPPPELR